MNAVRIRQYHYRVFGWAIKSNIEIPEFLPLNQNEATPDIYIEACSNLPDVTAPILEKAYYQASLSEFYIDIAPLAQFFVSGGNKIQIKPYKGANENIMRRYLLSRVFAVLLFQKGAFPLHACVLFQQKGIILTGKSTYASNTIAEALANNCLSSYLFAVQSDAMVCSGFGFSENKMKADTKIGLNNFKFVEVVSEDVNKISIQEIKGPILKLNHLQRNLAYGDVLGQLSQNKNMPNIKMLLQLPYFRLSVPISNFSYAKYLTYIKSMLNT